LTITTAQLDPGSHFVDRKFLVRARRAGDIERVFPNAEVMLHTNSDYLYRAVLPRDAVKQALVAMIDHIDYPNFKDSVEDGSLHAAYVSVWCAMAGLQRPPPDPRAGDPCEVSSILEKQTVAARRAKAAPPWCGFRGRAATDGGGHPWGEFLRRAKQLYC
jgi:hypothetical protein